MTVFDENRQKVKKLETLINKGLRHLMKLDKIHTIIRIGDDAFYHCSSLTSILWKGQTYNNASSFLKAFNAGQTATPTPTPTPTGGSSDSSDAEGKDAGDVAALRKIIKEQSALGAGVDSDLNSEQYEWSKDGRLTEIFWHGLTRKEEEDGDIYDVPAGLKGEISFSAFSALKKLWCGGNELTNIDVSGCTALEDFDCYANRLNSLDVSNCIALKELSCGGYEPGKFAYALGKLDLSKCTELTSLKCDCAGLTSLNVSTCTKLKEIVCYYNPIELLDVRGCTALEVLECEGGGIGLRISAIKVAGCKNLTYLNCQYNDIIKSLDLSGCTALKYLYCSMNEITTLDVSDCKIEAMSCDKGVTVIGCAEDIIERVSY